MILCLLNQLINVYCHNGAAYSRLRDATDLASICLKTDFGPGQVGGGAEGGAGCGGLSLQWQRLGTCVCPTLALVNHSCDPNCVQMQIGDHFVVIATSFIQKVRSGTRNDSWLVLVNLT